LNCNGLDKVSNGAHTIPVLILHLIVKQHGLKTVLIMYTLTGLYKVSKN